MIREGMDNPAAPALLKEHPFILLAHGGGGRLTHQLIGDIFAAAFESPGFELDHDGAVFDSGTGRLAFTTDSFVVDPLFFPGGDIGTLAVNGTVNDLAMCGARPLYLSVSFIIEEGFATESLWKIACSMRRAAHQARVRVVTGDTKVVDRGHGHGVFITTAGVGRLAHDLAIGPKSVRPGDSIILSGDIGRHGIAVMSAREGLSFETTITSDCAPLVTPVTALIDGGLEVHCLRDLTRGGLATNLVEIAQTSNRHLAVDGQRIPVSEEVKGACELLGLDPLYVANEGRFIVILPAQQSSAALSILRSRAPELQADIIGEVTGEDSGLVTMRTVTGAERIVDMLSGEQLPRIC